MNQTQKKLAMARINLIMLKKLKAIKVEETKFIDADPHLRLPTRSEILAMIAQGVLKPLPEQAARGEYPPYSDITDFFDFEELQEKRGLYAQTLGIKVNNRNHLETTQIELSNPLIKKDYYTQNSYNFTVPQFLDRAKKLAEAYQSNIDVISFGTDSEIMEIIKASLHKVKSHSTIKYSPKCSSI